MLLRDRTARQVLTDVMLLTCDADFPAYASIMAESESDTYIILPLVSWEIFLVVRIWPIIVFPMFFAIILI